MKIYFKIVFITGAILPLFGSFTVQASSQFAVNVDKYLFRAAKNGDLDYFKKLVEKKKANINYRTNARKTPLIKAAGNKKSKIVEYLLSLQDSSKKMLVNLNSVDKSGETALYKSCKNGDTVTAKMFIGAVGIDLNKQNKKGETALIRAAKNGYLEIVQELVKKGADKEIKNNKGNTALHEAAKAHQNKVVEFLVKNGADKNTRNKNGKIPVDYAKFDTKKLLVE